MMPVYLVCWEEKHLALQELAEITSSFFFYPVWILYCFLFIVTKLMKGYIRKEIHIKWKTSKCPVYFFDEFYVPTLALFIISASNPEHIRIVFILGRYSQKFFLFFFSSKN